jgi:hypothetical protein
VSGPKTTSGKLRFFVLFACAGGIAAGAWYVQNGGWSLHEQEAADDDDEDPAQLMPDAGATRRRSKKGGPHPKKKSGEGRQARSATNRSTATPTPPGPTGPSGPSYESAIAGSNLDLAPGTKGVPDLSDAELSGPMRNGTFLDACGVPSTTKVTVKVAIRHGRAVGVSAYATPPSREMAWCIERHVRGFTWPSNAKTDSFITSY